MELAPEVALAPVAPLLAADSLASRLAPDEASLLVALAEPASRWRKPESAEGMTGSGRGAPASCDWAWKSGGSTHAQSAKQAPTRLQARHLATNERMASGNKLLGVKQVCWSQILSSKQLGAAARPRHPGWSNHAPAMGSPGFVSAWDLPAGAITANARTAAWRPGVDRATAAWCSGVELRPTAAWRPGSN